MWADKQSRSGSLRIGISFFVVKADAELAQRCPQLPHAGLSRGEGCLPHSPRAHGQLAGQSPAPRRQLPREKTWGGGAKAISQCPERGWLLSAAAKDVRVQSLLLWTALSELHGTHRLVGKRGTKKERKGVRIGSLYRSPKPFVFTFWLLLPLCSFSNWNILFLKSKPCRRCGAVTKWVFITAQSGTIIVCKIPAASQKMSLCREPLLALRGEEDAGGTAGSWLPQGEELSVCIDITELLLRSNSLAGKRSKERKEWWGKGTSWISRPAGTKERYPEICYYIPEEDQVQQCCYQFKLLCAVHISSSLANDSLLRFCVSRNKPAFNSHKSKRCRRKLEAMRDKASPCHFWLRGWSNSHYASKLHVKEMWSPDKYLPALC